MKLSVRTKLFLTVSGLMLLFVIISLVFTFSGLEKFYIWQKKDILITNAKNVDAIYSGNPEDISLELERMGNTLGAGIFILTPDDHIKYSSFLPIFNQKLPERLPPFLRPHGSEHTDMVPPGPPLPFHPSPQLRSEEMVDSRTRLEMQQDIEQKIDFMVLRRQMGNDDTLVIRQTLAPISESAAVAAQFMVGTGAVLLLAGWIWAFFFAKNFTHPISELSHIAQGMAKLDFSRKCTIQRSDEIGELGNSINHLSDQLDAAIEELYSKNQQLMADVEKERRLDKMRKEFVSNVSHELKTPLSLILGYAEGLKENVAQDEEKRNFYSSVIIDEAEKMDKLVKDLLNLSQYDSGFFQLHRVDFELISFLHELLHKYQNVLAERGITVALDFPEDCHVNGDMLRIEQVVLNLLTNAINHADEKKKIFLQTIVTAEQVRLYVYNSGLPIPADSLEKIWGSFYKVDKARTREYGGYGLGLSIVRAIQDLHGNRYGVENMDDGVRFWIELDTTEK